MFDVVVVGMKFHEGGGGMMGYHHHNLMDMYPGPAINTMDWKNTSQVGALREFKGIKLKIY